jgi:hypothetical protein
VVNVALGFENQILCHLKSLLVVVYLTTFEKGILVVFIKQEPDVVRLSNEYLALHFLSQSGYVSNANVVENKFSDFVPYINRRCLQLLSLPIAFIFKSSFGILSYLLLLRPTKGVLFRAFISLILHVLNSRPSLVCIYYLVGLAFSKSGSKTLRIQIGGLVLRLLISRHN